MNEDTKKIDGKNHLALIAAIGKDGALGKDNQLLWHIPADLKRFKELTLGYPIIMGRKTFDSIIAVLGKPLPGRINVVVTRNTEWAYPGAVPVHSLEDGIQKMHALGHSTIFVGGGAQLYEQALPLADRLYLTKIEDEKEGDVFFPDYSDFKTVIAEERHEHEGLSYTWITLER